MSRPVMTYFPETKLAKLAARPGGLMRDVAIENAAKMLESMRGEADAAITQLMQEIETIVADANSGRLTADRMRAVLRTADQVVTLAGTFGYDALGRVMKSLCDVTDGLLQAGLDDAAPILVHVKSMHLVAPGSTQLTGPQIETMLSELAKILTHYNFRPLGVQTEPAGGVFTAR